MNRHRHRRAFRPGRGPFPALTPGPSTHANHKRHAYLCQLVVAGKAGLTELTELIDLRVRMGVRRAA